MDTYVVIEHEVGKPFDPPHELAQVVKGCGTFEREQGDGYLNPRVRKRYVLVMWAYPKR